MSQMQIFEWNEINTKIDISYTNISNYSILTHIKERFFLHLFKDKQETSIVLHIQIQNGVNKAWKTFKQQDTIRLQCQKCNI